MMEKLALSGTSVHTRRYTERRRDRERKKNPPVSLIVISQRGRNRGRHKGRKWVVDSQACMIICVATSRGRCVTWQWATCGSGGLSWLCGWAENKWCPPNYCLPWHWIWTNATYSFETSSNEVLLPQAPAASNYCFVISVHTGNISLIQRQPVQSNY